MNLKRVLSLGVLAFAGLTSAACSGNNSNGGLDADTQAKVDAVDNGFEHPTGKITSDSANEINASASSYGDAKSIFDSVLVVGTTGGSGCLRGSPGDGTYDLGVCVGATVSGSLEVSAITDNGDGTGTYAVQVKNACVGGAGGTTCVNGAVVVKTTNDRGRISASVVITASVTGPDGTTHGVSAGARGYIGGGALGADVVYLDSAGNSYHVDSTIVAGFGGYTITGAAGSAHCNTVLRRGVCQLDDGERIDVR